MTVLFVIIGALLIAVVGSIKYATRVKEELEELEQKVSALEADRVRLQQTLLEVKNVEEDRRQKNADIADADSDELLNIVNGMLDYNGTG